MLTNTGRPALDIPRDRQGKDAAGDIVTPDTLSRARARGLAPRNILAGHNSYSLFAALGDLVVTGPTLTNVNDNPVVLVA